MPTRNRRSGPWDTLVDLRENILDLENTNVKCLWFEQIDSGTSGSFSAPTNGTIKLNEWASGVDVLVSKIDTLPTFETVLDDAATEVTGTLDVDGNWTISGTPADGYPIALIYVYTIKLDYFDSNYTLEPATVEGINTLALVGQLTGEVMGFTPTDVSNSQFSIADTTGVATVEPSGADPFNVWVKGVQYTFSSAQTTTISKSEGVHMIYFDEDGVLQSTQSIDDRFADSAFVFYTYWNATNDTSLGEGEERHGIVMDGRTHHYLHDTQGAKYYSGLQASNITSDGSGADDVSAQMQITHGEFYDEDILNNTADSGQTVTFPAEIPVWYQDGATGTWRKDTATTYPVKSFVGGSSLLAYNLNTAGTWSQAELTNNDFVLCHIFATNDTTEPIIAIQGQADYTTIGQARLGAVTELASLNTIGLPSPEFVPLYTIIFQTSTAYSNAVLARIRTTDEGDDYVDWRAQSIVAGTGSGDGTVIGPASSTDNAIVRYDGTSGIVIQDSSATINDDGDMVVNGYVTAYMEETDPGIAIYPRFDALAYSDRPTSAGVLIAGHLRGTKDSPTVTLEDDWLGGFGVTGYADQERSGYFMRVDAAGDWGLLGAHEKPYRIHFLTVPLGSNVQTVRMTLTSEGDFGIGTEDPDALLQVAGNVTIGVDDDATGIPGILDIAGDKTGTATGAQIKMHLAADHDATIAYYLFNVNNDDLYIGPDTDSDALSFFGADGQFRFTAGNVHIGTTDAQYGTLVIAGHGTGSTTGGIVEIRTAADYDATIDYFRVRAVEDDLYIGPNTDSDALTYESVNAYWQFRSGYVQIGHGGKWGTLQLLGGGTGLNTGGSITFNVADDYDTTIDKFYIQVSQDDLYIGPDTDTDSLVYFGGTDEWQFKNGSVKIGADDVDNGLLTIYGDSAGTGNGGAIRLHTAIDYDTTVDYFLIKVNLGNLEIGPDIDTDSLKYTPSDSYWRFNGGRVGIGESGQYGLLSLLGHGTGSSQGGWLTLATADDYDSTISYFSIKASQDDLYIGPDTDSDSLIYNGAADRWEVRCGDFNVGNLDTTRGIMNCWAGAAGSTGGTVKLHVNQSYDDTIECFYIQANQDDLLIGPDTDTNSLTYTGANDRWNFNNGLLYIGAYHSVRGYIQLHGDASGVGGGEAVFMLSDDHDGTISHYAIKANEDDFIIGPSTDTDSFKYYGASDYWAFTGGDLRVGVVDAKAGQLVLYSNGTGSNQGGYISIQTAADHDTTIASYVIQVNQDDFFIGPVTDTDALKYDGGTGEWNFTNGILRVGVNDVTNGRVTCYGSGTGLATGGAFYAHLADDYDATVSYYQFRANNDQLIIGPNSDPNCLIYDPTTTEWQMNSGFLRVGESGTLYGSVVLQGDPTGSNEGGRINLHTADDFDTTIIYFTIRSFQDDLYIGPDTDTDSFAYSGARSHWIFTDGVISSYEKSSDPLEPAEGQMVVWMSDGTGKGDDGDVIVASKAGGSTTYTIIHDHSAGTAW